MDSVIGWIDANRTLIAHLVLIATVFLLLQITAAVLVYMERKVAAFVQQRHGPTLVGPRGLLQPLADIIKLIMKEELRPKGADKWLFYLAPVLSALAAFAAFSVVPFGGETTLFGLLDEPLPLQVTDVNVAMLVIFAITSMGIYGIVLAGWASNSKYSLLGGLRSAAQMISYELSFGLGLAALVVMAGTLSLREIVGHQAGYWYGFIPQWYVFLQPVGFLVFMIAGVAETNRAPFDFPEAEQELVAGYQTEYSSMSFALFWLGEYANVLLMCALLSILFLGGWLPPLNIDLIPWFDIPGFIWLFGKIFFFFFVFSWIKATVPRFRYDQLMRLGWKVFLPLSLMFVVLVSGWLMLTRWGDNDDTLIIVPVVVTAADTSHSAVAAR